MRSRWWRSRRRSPTPPRPSRWRCPCPGVRSIRTVIDDRIATRSAAELAAALRAHEFTSRDLLELYLDRIARLDGEVNAVVTLDAERARTAADAADAATARGDVLGPLHGLPVTIKDAIETEGIRSTGGARELIDHVPTADAPAVARSEGRRGHRLRQDQPAAVVGRLPDVQRHLRGDQQPLGPRPHRGWFVGRRGGRGRERVHQLRARHRHRRLGAHPRALLRGVLVEAELRRRPAARLPRPRGRRHHRRRHQRVRADHAQRRRSRPPARRPRRPRTGARAAWRLELPRCDATSLAELRIGTWLDDPASPVDSEYVAMLRAAVRASPTRVRRSTTTVHRSTSPTSGTSSAG